MDREVDRFTILAHRTPDGSFKAHIYINQEVTARPLGVEAELEAQADTYQDCLEEAWEVIQKWENDL